MKQRMRINQVRLGVAGYRVVRPAQPADRAVLHEDNRCLSMYVDHRAATGLVTAWGLAARSSRSMVYLPMRANPPPRGVNSGQDELVRLDLVLLHHSLQFPASRWKEVRARLGPGRPHTATVPDSDLPGEQTVDHERQGFREFRDHLGFDVAARTLFVVGSPTAFRETGSRVRALVDDAPSYLDRYPDAGHFCVELSAGPWAEPKTRRQVATRLHIQYSADWLI